MIEYQLSHHVQIFIINALHHQKSARFSELRKPGIDSNLFAYHLKLLIKNNFIVKVNDGYSLGEAGLVYVDQISTNLRTQPKIATMLVVQNSDGDILLQKRHKQPYIDTWTLPYGKLRIDDASVAIAARREATEKLNLSSNVVIERAGDCYIRVAAGSGILSSTLVHVFRIYSDDIQQSASLMWARPHKLSAFNLAPAVEQIVTRTFFRDPHFFEEFDVELS